MTGANTLVGLDTARDYALDRGIVLSDDDDAVSAMILISMGYFKGLYFKGDPVTPLQGTPFPRTGVYIGRYKLPSDVVPNDVISAQCELIIAQFNGIDLFPSTDVLGMIIQDTTGPLTTKYSDKFGALSTPGLPLVEALLSQWLTGDGPYTLRSIRV